MATFNVVMRQLREGQNSFSKCFTSNIGSLSKTLDQALLRQDTIKYFLGFPRHISTAFALPVSPKLTTFTGTRQLHYHDERNFKTSVLVQGQKRLSLDFPHSNVYTPSFYSEHLAQFSTVSSDPSSKSKPGETENVTKTDSASSGSGDSSSGKDEEKKETKKESWFRGKHSWKLGLLFMTGSAIWCGGVLIYTWGAPLTDPDGNTIEDEYTGQTFSHLKRTWKEMNIFKKSIADPSREKLLPEPLKYPYMQPPYTLVMELKDVLIHPDWTYSTGWRFKKRPALDYFLSQVGPPLFEVVVYSSEAGMTLDPIVSQLDPQGFIMYRLYRDATRYMDNHHVKDLSCLNRDESRIIIVDSDGESVKLQPQNALVLSKWSGEDDDRKLVDLAHFLKTIAASGVEDVRPVLEYYHKFDDPLEAFKENQRKFQEDQAERNKQVAEESKKKSWFSGLSGNR